jgi:uncharacterized LabA/DUF88 family protein
VDTANYLFIDGNYLRARYQERMTAFFGNEGDLDLRKIRQASGASKAFYYDCIDENATDVSHREAFLRQVQRYDGFHVRQGTVSQGKRKRQKQVDVQLAVDMLTHAFRKNFWHATLVAGDLDFRPLVEELVLLGAHIHVFYARTSVAQELLDTADSVLEMDLWKFWEWSTNEYQRQNPIPTQSGNDSSPLTPIVRRGKWGGRIVEQFEQRDATHLFWVHPDQDHHSLSVRFRDPVKLEEFFTSVHGPIVWD